MKIKNIENILVVVNPVSGRGNAKSVYPEYSHYLNENKFRYFTYYTTGENDADNIKRLVANSNFDLVSILGGDGTLNLVLNAINSTDILLHIIPCGLGNDFIISLSGNKRPSQYFSLLKKGEIRSVDSFLCNGKVFVVAFGVGFDGAVSYMIEKLRHKRFPMALAYWLSIFAIISSFKEVQIEINKEKQKVFMLTLANTPRFGGGFKIAPGAEVDDKLLDYVMIHEISPLKRIANLLRVKNGKHLDLPIVEHKKVSALSIFCDKETPAHIDGELIQSVSFDIRFNRKIRVLC